jgi:hypothetical protein
MQNLTRQVTRALLFRNDGWTQPWILMRVPESNPVQAKTPASEKAETPPASESH